MSKRKFTREFKLAAVKKVIEQGLSFAEVARQFDIPDTYIHGWKKKFEEEGALQAADADASLAAELKRLRAENRQLKTERDILKKAAAYFAKENS